MVFDLQLCGEVSGTFADILQYHAVVNYIELLEFRLKGRNVTWKVVQYGTGNRMGIGVHHCPEIWLPGDNLQ